MRECGYFVGIQGFYPDIKNIYILFTFISPQKFASGFDKGIQSSNATFSQIAASHFFDQIKISKFADISR